MCKHIAAANRSFATDAGAAPAVALTGRRRFNLGGLGGDGGR